MATMRQIRSRIRVAKNIQQITKAMKMVAAARLKRAQERVQSSRPYSQKMRQVMEDLARAAGSVEHPLLERRPVKHTGVLLITANRGLAGSYNAAVIRRAQDFLSSLDPSTVRLYVVGKKGQAFFRRRGYTLAEAFVINENAAGLGEAMDIANRLQKQFVTGGIDELYVIYTRFQSALTQRPTVLKVLPIEPPQAEAVELPPDYIFEPQPGVLLGQLLPQYVVTQIHQALLESVASEHGARMTSMSSATDNAGKMISTLTLSLNRARQAGITKEISEIVGGAEALKG
ncbi:MAG: ATP synthase F1 subunit gamma [Chthonomonadales bacterium]